MPFQPSPFPGMDPYLQAEWRSVHGRLIGDIADALAPQLADDLAARVEATVHDDQSDDDDDDDNDAPTGDRPQTRWPDVAIIGNPSAAWDGSRPAGSAAAVADPILLTDPRPATTRWVQIRDPSGNRIVTSIELLSPWNKLPAGGGRRAYLRKRQEVLDSRSNLVEIDLVRAGDWTAMIRPFEVPRSARTPYRVTVSRAHPPGGPLGLYPVRLADPLPVVRVPLRPGEPDVTLDLQQLVDAIYRNGRYDRTDYAADCDPPLAGDDAAWADGLLRAAGRRA